MEIVRVSAEEIKEIAPMVSEFRVFLKSLKGIRSEGNIPAGEAELQEYLQAEFPVYAAKEENGYCGYIVCRVEAPCVWAESVYVKPEHRRKGVAAALFEQAELLAHTYGEETVYNYVHPNNDAMISFLRKRGYTVLNLLEIRKPYGKEKLQTQIKVAGHVFDY